MGNNSVRHNTHGPLIGGSSRRGGGHGECLHLIVTEQHVSATHTHTDTHTHARTHAHIHTHTYTHTHARTHAHTHTHARTRARTLALVLSGTTHLHYVEHLQNQHVRSINNVFPNKLFHSLGSSVLHTQSCSHWLRSMYCMHTHSCSHR